MRYRKDSFLVIPNKELLRGKAPQLQALYFWLCEHSNKQGTSFPTRQTLAEESGMSVRTVDMYTKELLELGILEKENRFSGNEKISNLYHVIIKEQGGSTPDVLPGASGTPPVEQSVPIELNPVLTQSTEISVSEETHVSFEKWVAEELGWSTDSGGEAPDGSFPDIMVDDHGRPVKKAQLKSARAAYLKAYPPLPKAVPSSVREVQQVIDWISYDLQREFGTPPVFGVNERVILASLIKRQGFQFVKEYGRWFFQNPDIPAKFKFGVKSFASNSFINQYLAAKNGR